jgi:DNA-binding PadR family transcriptional regulator
MPRKTKTVTDAELAVMSLLAEKPMYGYQIEQIIEERGMRDWTNIGFSSIYYILEKLKKIDWLESVLECGEGKGPARQIHSLTTTGRNAWKKAVINALSTPLRSNSNFQLGLSNLLHLEKSQIISALEKYVKELEQKYQQVSEKLTNHGSNLPWNVSAMFDLSLTQIKTESDWVKEFIKKIDLITP